MSEFEALSISQLAIRFITTASEASLPKTLHDALNNIFTKGNGSVVKYRELVVKKVAKDSANNTVAHRVFSGREYAIYNALCLYAVLGTSETKRLYRHYYETKHQPNKRDFSMLHNVSKERYLEFVCFGIVKKNIIEIEASLLRDDFDLFTQQLPSPFATTNDKLWDLSPMLHIYEQRIPWNAYMDSYRKAESYFEQKDFNKAREELDRLEVESCLHLPVIQSLRLKVDAEIREATEAWNYFQKIIS